MKTPQGRSPYNGSNTNAVLNTTEEPSEAHEAHKKCGTLESDGLQEKEDGRTDDPACGEQFPYRDPPPGIH